MTFAQLLKVNGTKVTGVVTAEVPDRDREILDYLASKPNFIAWSRSILADSGGKSYGNVRFQHDPQRPVGRLTNISFDDAKKQITVTAEILEQETRDLLEAGVLTGFSIGGSYAWRVRQPDGTTRYCAIPAEVSVVDRPSVPGATFTVTNAQGVTLTKRFPTPAEKTRGEAELMLLKGYPAAFVAEALRLSFGELARVAMMMRNKRQST